MFYIMYLYGLCTRRHWPSPHYTTTPLRTGYACTVRVNNREYSTDDMPYISEDAARNAAATRAYMICRSFSVNDGMLPGDRPMAGGYQGVPVAIGSGRRGSAGGDGGYETRERESERESERRGGRSRRDTMVCASANGGGGGYAGSHGEDGGSLSGSGGESPRSVDSIGWSASGGHGAPCACRRAEVRAYERCEYCLREFGY